jgi:hypothetical protein
VAVAASLLLYGLALAPGATANGLKLGFFDGTFTGPNAATWLQRAAAAGSDVVRIEIGWDVADTPQKPAGFDARNPSDPHYDFSVADQAIRLAQADGLEVIASFTGAPRWAEGGGMPAGVAPGSWRPSPSALHDYGVALGRRYSGSYPDPLHPGQTLPRVMAFQLWNEPNLDKYLTPQWTGNRTASPAIYRAMLNAFYRGVKSVDQGALVVTAGTAPFGDPQPGGERIMPAHFWRDLLCERITYSGGLAGTRCPHPAHFDVMAHHPYSVGRPDTKALNADDVSIPDLGKLTRLLRFGERTGRALPHIHHQLWITEVGYNTKPPNPAGVPVWEEARWLLESLELLWSQGADLITWNTIVDQPPIPDYSSTSQAGVYYLDGAPKPSLGAFSFPLVASRASGARVSVWGRAPVGGRLKLERRAGSTWAPLTTVSVSRHSTFRKSITVTPGSSIRATIGAFTSLVWPNV